MANASRIGSLVTVRLQRQVGITAGAGAALAAVGLAVLAGWALDIAPLKNLFAGLATMKANTALGFVVLGAALWCEGHKRYARAASALGAVALLLGALSLSQDLWGWHAGIDELVFRDPDTLPPAAPGRPSPATSLMLVLLGAALVLLPHAPAAAQGFSLLTALLALLSLLGYLFGAPGLYRVWIFSSVALHTALGFVVAAAGLLAARPGSGWVADLTRDTPGAQMGRRLLGAVLVVLPVVGWLRFKGEQWGWFGDEVGTGIMVLSSAVLLGGAILWSVRALNAIQAQRDAAQAEQAEYAERLRILHAVDRAILEQQSPEDIARAALTPLRNLLGAARVAVNLFDLAAGEVEWLGAVGRQRTHSGPGVRYPIALMGDIEALGRGVPQHIDTNILPPSPHKDALLASGVAHYMAVPMIAGGELIGSLSFGGTARDIRGNEIGIAAEVAAQMAIAISQARLNAAVRRHASSLEQQVRERTAQLTAANKELESFSHSVSHDLRSPLRAVDGFARMLEEDHAGNLGAEGLRLLGVVRASTARMGQLIEDLLAFSRFGRQAMQYAAIDMSELVRAVLTELQPDARVRVTLGELPPAQGDAALLRQVWTNLLSNALKYSGKRDAPELSVTGRAEGDALVYCVADNGAGFDMRYVHQLFGVFKRLHREDEFPGTGVGLAIVQRIVARHGGRLWAEGAIDRGAKFFFSLPREAGH